MLTLSRTPTRRSTTRLMTFVPALLAALLAAGCARPPVVTGSPAALPELPVETYRQAAARGAAVYTIDPAETLLLLRTGRSGPAKNLGHDHIIASESVRGFVAIDGNESRADLLVPLAELIVDKPAYRERYGFEPLAQSAIDGTTRNMQDKVLESALYPAARVSITQTGDTTLAVTVTMRGAGFTYDVPATLAITEGTVQAAGEMTLRHEELGLTPFSAAGGLLKVADDIALSFTVVANRSETVAQAVSTQRP